jgi:hypothetical protein
MGGLRSRGCGIGGWVSVWVSIQSLTKSGRMSVKKVQVEQNNA